MPTSELIPRDKGSVREWLFDEPFTALQHSINDELQRFTRRFGTGLDWEPMFGSALAPALSVSEKDNVIHVEADLPGLDAKDIDVTVDGDLLTLKGERREEQEEKGRYTYRRERRFGAFERTVRLPARVQADKVSAAFHKGVLTIDMPVVPEDKKRAQKIAVKGD